MPTLHEFAKLEVPRDVAAQIRAYQRIQWPHLDELIGPKLWDVAADSKSRSFVVLDGEKLVSHAEANVRTIQHGGATFRVGGLSAVFTYPAYRGRGFAQQVVGAATQFIDSGSDADLALLFCAERVLGLYKGFGWKPLRTARIYYGNRMAPALHEGTIVAARFISTAGRSAQREFEEEPVYVGERTW